MPHKSRPPDAISKPSHPQYFHIKEHSQHKQHGQGNGRRTSERVPGTFRTVEPSAGSGPFSGAVSPLSKPLSSASVGTLLMFQCATVVGLVFLLVMSKSDPGRSCPSVLIRAGTVLRTHATASVRGRPRSGRSGNVPNADSVQANLGGGRRTCAAGGPRASAARGQGLCAVRLPDGLASITVPQNARNSVCVDARLGSRCLGYSGSGCLH